MSDHWLAPAQDLAELAKLEAGGRYVTGEFWTVKSSSYTHAGLWG